MGGTLARLISSDLYIHRLSTFCLSLVLSFHNMPTLSGPLISFTLKVNWNHYQPLEFCSQYR